MEETTNNTSGVGTNSTSSGASDGTGYTWTINPSSTAADWIPSNTPWVYQTTPSNEQNVREISIRETISLAKTTANSKNVDDIIEDANKIANFILNGK